MQKRDAWYIVEMYMHAYQSESTRIDLPLKGEIKIKNQIHIQEAAPHVQLLHIHVAVMLAEMQLLPGL